MFSMAKVKDLPAVMDRLKPVEIRALKNAINSGRGLTALERVGYEIISIPSASSSTSLDDRWPLFHCWRSDI